MPSVREHLIFKALAALDEVKEAARSPIQPAFTVRFCLAFLFSQGNGRRDPYDDFWRCMQDACPTSTDGGRSARPTNLTICINGIISDLGFNPSPTIMTALREAGTKGAVIEFWKEVQWQLDDGRPMPSPRIKRG